MKIKIKHLRVFDFFIYNNPRYSFRRHPQNNQIQPVVRISVA